MAGFLLQLLAFLHILHYFFYFWNMILLYKKPPKQNMNWKVDVAYIHGFNWKKNKQKNETAYFLHFFLKYTELLFALNVPIHS